MEKIVINISPFGLAKVDAQGFEGGACKKHIQKISGLLGATENEITDKPELFSTQTETDTDIYATE